MEDKRIICFIKSSLALMNTEWDGDGLDKGKVKEIEIKENVTTTSVQFDEVKINVSQREKS